MERFILKIVVTIITSFYLFPIQFTYLPMGYNTKKIMAAIGLVLLLIQLAKKKSSELNKDIFILSVAAMIVSLCGIASVIWNETNDYTYASYIMSMWVWLGGAYTTITLMRWIHGTVSIPLLCNYFIAVCVVQCILALTIDMYAPLQQFINSIYYDGSYFTKIKRLYGLGASLDVAGSRFSIVLIMITFLLVKWGNIMLKKELYLYFSSFLIIAIVGNMMARTTTVGLIISLIYLLYASNHSSEIVVGFSKQIWKYALISLMIGLPIILYYYLNNPSIHTHIRFAFEGFFSLVERGVWEVYSNEKLETMIVFPDNLKTWIIGDGYFNSPLLNPYFTGTSKTEYYMGTDIGYLRFIFYFGVIGLSTFIYYFLLLGHLCMKRFSNEKILFVLFLFVNFIVWFKVSTDIFLAFAPFLCISKEEEEEAAIEEIEEQEEVAITENPL